MNNATDTEPELRVFHLGVAQDIPGPGKRLVIWTAGCDRRCPGCIEQRLWDEKRGALWTVDMLERTTRPYLDQLGALTLSGGEPTRWAAALRAYLERFRPRPHVTLFTGCEADEFMQRFPHLATLVDLCIAGPFMQSRHGNHLWRGSTNQILFSPSGQHGQAQLDRWVLAQTAGIQTFVEQEHLNFYGIPPPGLLETLRRKLHRDMKLREE